MKGTAAVLRLDKARGNAIDEPLVRELTQAARDLGADASVRGVLLDLRASEALLPRPRPRDPDRARPPRDGALHAPVRGDGVGALRPAQPDGRRGQRTRRGRRLHPRPDRRPPRPAPRRRADRPQRGARSGCPCRGASPSCCARPCRPTRCPRWRSSAATSPTTRRCGSGLARRARGRGRASRTTACARLEEFVEKDAYALVTTKAALRQDVLARMKADERERMGGWLDGWFSEPTRARLRELAAGLTKPR